MIFTPLSIPDVILIEPRIFQDPRGFFMETYQSTNFAEHGIPQLFVQDNHSGSVERTLRGLHYQIQHAQGKLVRVIAGQVFDVAVDLRKSSPHFGKWVASFLSSENHKLIWIPPGFAHGFFVVSKWAEVLYKATDYYAPLYERTLLWDDPTVQVEWPTLDNPPIISAKDALGAYLQDCELFG